MLLLYTVLMTAMSTQAFFFRYSLHPIPWVCFPLLTLLPSFAAHVSLRNSTQILPPTGSLLSNPLLTSCRHSSPATLQSLLNLRTLSCTSPLSPPESHFSSGRPSCPGLSLFYHPSFYCAQLATPPLGLTQPLTCTAALPVWPEMAKELNLWPQNSGRP